MKKGCILTLPQDIYVAQLEIINGITFTRREIDIIACILSGKSAKKIAVFLSISPKTVENHIRNIMLKLGCRSQENIIDFIEKSGKFIFVKNHYSILLIQVTFELALKKISELTSKKSPACLMVYDKEQKNFISLLQQIENHLKLAGITTSAEPREKYKSAKHFLDEIKGKPIDNILYNLSAATINQLQTSGDIGNLEISQLASVAHKNPGYIIFLFLDRQDSLAMPKELLSSVRIDLAEQNDYYFFVLKIIKRLLPAIALDEIFVEFQNQYHILFQRDAHKVLPADNLASLGTNTKPQSKNFLRKWKSWLGIGIVSCLGFLLFISFNDTEHKNKIASLKIFGNKTQNLKADAPGLAAQINAGHPINWNFPRQDHVFVGRENLLDKLHMGLISEQKISKNFNIAQPHPLVVNVCMGLGGVGKTQLILEYANHVKHPYTLKAWFSAENSEELSQKYIEFAKALGYTENELKIGMVTQYVKEWLSTNPGWLLVFDNVNSYKEIEPFLPEDGGHVILTTRHRSWPAKFKTFSVDVMTEEEAIGLIESLVNRDIKKEEIATKELVKTVGYLPLALAQAGTYIQQNQITINQYLDLYKKYEMKLLAESTLPQGANARTVSVTWNITLSKISEEAKKTNKPSLELELLTVCAYLFPDKISESVLLAWLKIAHPELPSPELSLHKHISQLWQYSILDKDESGNINVHRLLQAVVRHQQSSSLSLKWYNHILEAVHEEFQRTTNVLDKESRQQSLLLHLQSLVNYYDFYWPMQFSEKLGDILIDTGTVLNRMGDPISSKNFYERALNVYTAQHGKVHPKVAIAMRNLGNAYRSLEDAKAKEFLEDALSIQEKCYAPGNLEIAITLSDLGNAYGDLGNAKQKKILLERALSIIEQHYGTEDPQVATILHGLARANTDLGNYNEAMLLFDRSIKINEAHYGKEHIKLATTLHNSANNHLELGNYKQAVVLFERALQVKSQHYGKEHTQIAITLCMV